MRMLESDAVIAEISKEYTSGGGKLGILMGLKMVGKKIPETICFKHKRFSEGKSSLIEQSSFFDVKTYDNEESKFYLDAYIKSFLEEVQMKTVNKERGR